MTDDVVAELERWLEQYRRQNYGTTKLYDDINRARDEIVALRRIVNGLVASGARAAALEEAAQACDRRRDMTGEQSAYAVLDVESYTSACSGCAYDIRALKERRDE